jgi:hypothetical protein
VKARKPDIQEDMHTWVDSFVPLVFIIRKRPFQLAERWQMLQDMADMSRGPYHD